MIVVELIFLLNNDILLGYGFELYVVRVDNIDVIKICILILI